MLADRSEKVDGSRDNSLPDVMCIGVTELDDDVYAGAICAFTGRPWLVLKSLVLYPKQ